ncbi:MAG TPA: L,D-transpeptidase family protein, partial [Solirubrobacteraceae bacterium]
TPTYSPYRPAPQPRRGRGRLVVGFLLVVVLVVGGLAAAVLIFSGATLKTDPKALARVEVQTFGGSLVSAKAVDAHGKPVPLRNDAGVLTPTVKLTPGEHVSVDVVVKRPSYLSWVLGKQRHERLTIAAPVATPTSRWLTVARGSGVSVGFDRDVVAVAYGDASLARHQLDGPSQSVSLGRRNAAGSLQIAAAARPWERLGAPQTVSWFPKSASPVAVVSPAPGGNASPAGPLRLTFSDPVDQALGSATPKLSPGVPGSWSKADSHTLVFHPTGYGVGFDTKITAALPKAVMVTGPAGTAVHTTKTIQWQVPSGSYLRLHQMLAQAGYLPVTWKPAGKVVPNTPEAQTKAAVDPPKGTFSWRYPNTPPELKALWNPNKRNDVTRGAIMMFQDQHGLDVDSFAGPSTWKAVFKATIAGKQNPNTPRGYSYVYVHESSPQSLTLWHNGHTVITSPGNTGIASAPTAQGTFPVFEHMPVTTMSGTNPGGSHYSDPGIKWVSYFNGGDAIHTFNRASFGTPQSLGCVELPEASAAKVYPYTPIGTLVTVEN